MQLNVSASKTIDEASSSSSSQFIPSLNLINGELKIAIYDVMWGSSARYSEKRACEKVKYPRRKICFIQSQIHLFLLKQQWDSWLEMSASWDSQID